MKTGVFEVVFAGKTQDLNDLLKDLDSIFSIFSGRRTGDVGDLAYAGYGQSPIGLVIGFK